MVGTQRLRLERPPNVVAITAPTVAEAKDPEELHADDSAAGGGQAYDKKRAAENRERQQSASRAPAERQQSAPAPDRSGWAAPREPSWS